MHEALPLRDADWLRRQVENGVSAAEIAVEVGCTTPAVRLALHRYGVLLPSDLRTQHVDWSQVEHDWRKGYPVADFARLYRLTTRQVVYRMRDVPRVPLRGRPSKYPLLNDPAWLRGQLARGQTVVGIGRSVGADKRLVVAALRRHGITAPARTMTRVERVEVLEVPSERVRAAELLVAEVSAEIAEARRIRDEARAAARRQQSP